MSKEAWRTFNESALRGLEETPLRALNANKILLQGQFVLINTMGQCSVSFGASYLGASLYPVSEVPISCQTVSAPIGDIVAASPMPPGFGIDTLGYLIEVGGNQMLLIRPSYANVGQVFGPYGPGDYLGIVAQYGADIDGWDSFMPTKSWVAAPANPPIVSWLNEHLSAYSINGIAVWPREVPYYSASVDPGGRGYLFTCTSNQRLGANLALCKAGIKGIVTIHDVINRPTGLPSPSDGALVSAPVNRDGMFYFVNITYDVSNYYTTLFIYPQLDPEHQFSCGPNQIICFWIGAQSIGDLPNSGAPDYRPIQFNPSDYGLLSTFAWDQVPLH